MDLVWICMDFAWIWLWISHRFCIDLAWIWHGFNVLGMDLYGFGMDLIWIWYRFESNTKHNSITVNPYR